MSLAMLLAIRSIGESSLHAAEHQAGASTDTAPHAAPANATSSTLPHLLGGLVVVIVAARLTGRVLLRFGQPRVMGEVIAGILLGPSVLGYLSPQTMTFLFPTSLMPILSAIAQLGVILYMFLVGLELNAGVLRSRAHATFAISSASIAVPFVAGTALALWLYPIYAPAGVAFTSFSLFIGLSLAITAFPVLARILTDRGMAKTELGVISLGCAAAGDVTAWCLLAVVIGIAQANLTGAATTMLLTLGYVAAMFLLVRPAIRFAFTFDGTKSRTDFTALVFVAVLASALATDLIGIHALFGAFLLGAIIPHDSPLAISFRGKLEDVVTILLMPAFFAYAGLRTQIGLLSTTTDWLICAAVILVATLGKFGGTVLAARYTGLDWRMSSSLGVLMNTRGLMELIVLNIGLDLGILSPALFATMVIMALVTTLATTPLLNLFNRQRPLAEASYNAAA